MDKLFKSETSKKLYGTQTIVLGAVILAIAVLHFVIQMTFVRDEKARLDKPEVQTVAVHPGAEIQPDSKTEISEASITDKQPLIVENTQISAESKANNLSADLKTPELKESRRKTRPAENKAFAAAPSRKTERIAAERPQSAEKPRRETKSDRIRRAERILTGV